MSRVVVSYDDIIDDDYNNDVDNVTNRIASAINREGTQVPNLGTMLGKRICTNLERNTGKTLCGLNKPSDLNIVITNLPVYFIIAHSTVDIHLRDSADNSGVELDPDYPIFSTVQWNGDLSQSQFLVNTTTVGGWGLLDEDVSCIPRGHLLDLTSSNIRSHLFSPDIRCERRIDMYIAEEGEHGRSMEKKNNSYPPLFNITGTKYINKIHQFGGERLSGGGFGIVKLTGNNPVTASNLLSTWSQEKGSNQEKFKDNIYFLSDSDLTEQDIRLYTQLENTWNRKGPYMDGSYMWNAEMSMSDILNHGGPGIYISLSCSEYSVEGLGRPLELENSNSPDHILLGKISEIFKALGSNNRNEWDKFTKELKYNPPISTRTTAETPSSSALSRVNLQGPAGTSMAIERRGSIASRVKRAGKRKTRRKVRRKTKRKTRRRVRRKTKRKIRRKTKRKRRKTKKK